MKLSALYAVIALFLAQWLSFTLGTFTGPAAEVVAPMVDRAYVKMAAYAEASRYWAQVEEL
ncbi:MAG: hypothetical protein C0436_00145 [Alphaproteobacteria bacterium]|nr:hypothetical protein [Alphaproteobacteria bacterium]